jgi:hypothetical protein
LRDRLRVRLENAHGSEDGGSDLGMVDIETQQRAHMAEPVTNAVAVEEKPLRCFRNAGAICIVRKQGGDEFAASGFVGARQRQQQSATVIHDLRIVCCCRADAR